MRPWSAGDDNGGATAQGVTADSIKVVVLIPPADKDKASTNGGIKNQATGANGLSKDAVLDENAVLAHSYQTWGRTIEYEFVEASGTDETAQRADAVSVIAKKPFMVLDTALYASGGGGLVFEQAVKAAGVPVYPNAPSPTDLLKPYEVNMAEWAGKELVGGKAQFGGDAVKDKKRGLRRHLPGRQRRHGPRASSRRRSRSTEARSLPARPCPTRRPTDPAAQSAAYQEQAPPLIAKLKQAGVTTVVNFAGAGLTANATGSFTKQATSQDWFPEWLVSGVPYNDLDFFARSLRPGSSGRTRSARCGSRPTSPAAPATRSPRSSSGTGARRRARTRRASSRTCTRSTTA